MYIVKVIHSNICYIFAIPSMNVMISPSSSINGVDSSVCASTCNCSSSIFELFCGNDGITYFSACHADCSEAIQGNVRSIEFLDYGYIHIHFLISPIHSPMFYIKYSLYFAWFTCYIVVSALQKV